MVYENENVIGIYDRERGVLCSECMRDEDLTDQDQIITEENAEEQYVFCDKCKKRLA